jgi:hypothetical protein
MKTMNFQRCQPPSFTMRLLFLLLSTASVIGAALSLSGVPLSVFPAVPVAVAFVLLHRLGSHERT